MTLGTRAVRQAPALGGACLTLLFPLGCGSARDSTPLVGISAAGAANAGGSGSAGVGFASGGTAANEPGGTGGDLSSPSPSAGGSTASTAGSANAGTGADAPGGASATGGVSAGGGAGAGGAAVASAGGSGVGCPGLFCEDFEHGSLDPAVWNTQTSLGQTVVVESAVVAHGKYAAQFHAKPNLKSYDFIISKNAPAALRGHHFGRAYFDVSPKPPAQHTGFLFAGTAGFPKLKYLEVAGLGASWQLTYVDLIGTGESYASGGSAPTASWVCLEWEFDDAPDRATVFVDGKESFTRSSITFNGQSTGLVGGFSDFGFGYYAWHPATEAFDIYYDDIVLDTKRVSCLPPM